MTTAAPAASWVAPAPPASVIPAEAFDVGEPERAGAVDVAAGAIAINAGRETKTIEVTNTGDRPIQVGSHYHLFEANRHLAFDREAAYGFHLDVPSGSAIRFEPGQTHRCRITRFAGNQVSMGMNDLTNGSMRSELTKTAAVQKARQQGYGFTESADRATQLTGSPARAAGYSPAQQGGATP